MGRDDLKSEKTKPWVRGLEKEKPEGKDRKKKKGR